MRRHKKIVFVLLTLLIVSMGITLMARRSYSQNNPSTKKTVKVLRRGDQLGQPPTMQEMAAVQASPTPVQPQRELEDKIPKHLPIKVQVKNLNNENWTRELEVEVKNTGDKPIYFLMFTLILDDVKMENGDDIGFPFRYGRPELYTIENRATPEDVPLRPGETYIIKAPKGLTLGWEKFRARHNMPRPKKFGLQFHALNFGDGTGFHTTGGLPVPRPRPSSISYANQGSPGTSVTTAINNAQGRPPDPLVKRLSTSLPVSFLPVNFSPPKFIEPALTVAAPQSGLCCPSTSCFYLRQVNGQGNCFCEDGIPSEAPSVSDCSDPIRPMRHPSNRAVYL